MEIPHGHIKDDVIEERLRKQVDDLLRLRFNDRRERWVLYRISPRTGIWDPVRVLESPEGEFVPLDGRVVEQALLGDTWRRARGVKDILDEIQEENQAKREREMARLRDACEVASKDVEHASAGRAITFPRGDALGTKPGRVRLA